MDKNKFTILEDGKRQAISVFEEVTTSSERLRRVTVGPREFSNEYEGDAAAARYTVIAIDRINTTTMDMQRLRLGLEKFLQEVADSGEPILLVGVNASSIEVLQDFTTDPKVLALALQRNKTAAGRPDESSTSLNEGLAEIDNLIQERDRGSDPVIDTNGDATNAQSAHLASRLAQLNFAKAQEQKMIAFQQRSLRITSLEALQMLAQSLAGLPGRKSLVWASSGYPFAVSVREGRFSTGLDFSQVVEAGNLDEYTMHVLNDANIAVYPIDARGTINTAYQVIDPSHQDSPSYAEKDAARFNNQEKITTFENIAKSTGGEPCFERADLSGCFKDAMDEAREYYVVGYYAEANLKPGWHRLQVKVDAAAKVRSRTGFMYSKLDADHMRTNDMRLQLASQLPDPGVPFRGSWATQGLKGDHESVSFDIDISPRARLASAEEQHLNLDIAAVARARDGSIAGQFTQHIDRQIPPSEISTIERSGIHYRNTMELRPGDYLVRVVVRDDNTGRMGSTTTLVTVN